jgi:membrane protease YdiL (CAAX protease family)
MPTLPESVPPVIDAAAPPIRPVSRARWWIFFLLIGFYPLAMGLIGSSRSPTRGPALTHTARGMLVVCILGLVLFGALFFLAWAAPQPSADELRLRWRGGFWIVPLAIGYSVAVRFMLAAVGIIVATILLVAGVMTSQAIEKFVSSNRPDLETLVDISALRDNPAYYWLSLTLVSFVVAGLREELWRSGFLAGTKALWPRAFGSRGGQILAAALGAVVFGLGHLPQGILAVCLTGVLGFVLAVIMILHRSIWPAVIAHGTFDATSLAMLPAAMDLIQKVHPS